MRTPKNKVLILLTAAVSLGSSCLCFAGNYGLTENEKILSAYVVNGVELQNLSIAEAREALQKKFRDDYGKSTYQVMLGELTYDFDLFPALSLDVDDIIYKAYLDGVHNDWSGKDLDYGKLRTSENTDDHLIQIERKPVVSDPEALLKQVEASDLDTVSTIRESVCNIEDYRLVIHKGKDGVRSDYDLLLKKISEALENQEYDKTLICPSIKVKTNKIDFQPIYNQIHKLKVDAYLDPRNQLEVLPSQAGISFDVDEADQIYSEAAEDSNLVINFTYTKPEITTKEMEERIFRDELAHVEVTGSGSSGRMNNISLACAYCNNKVLLPGEVFSYNDTVGERTSERGFMVAGVYSGGTVVQGVGGGICQVSSTIYDTALYADLEIVERKNHSLTVSYLPLGMDATVNWGTQDFKFKNNTKYPLKLLINYKDGIVRATLLGTKLDQNTVEIINESTGGASCVTYRKVYDEQGNLIKDELVSKSSYQGYH